ncbi:MAG: nucleotidyltransferase family protein [Pseudomonadota bacterium]
MSERQPTNRFPFTTLILVGGLGTRLRSVVSDRPKPMALVEGMPFLEVLIRSLVRKGLGDFVLLTGHMADMIERHFDERPIEGAMVRFSKEDAPLGTGGAVRNALEFAGDPSLLVNGDTFFDADVAALHEFHLKTGADATLSLTMVDDASRYGSVATGATGMVLGFREKSQAGSGPGLINAGVSMLSLRFIETLPSGRAFSMEQEIFPGFAGTGKMFGLVQDGAFFDIGTPESYREFGAFVRMRNELLT